MVTKRKLFALLLLLLPLVFSGCSFTYYFVVTNESAGEIVVQYRLKRWKPVPPGTEVKVEEPAKLTLDRFEAADRQWRKLIRDEYLLDKATGTLQVKVLPGEAVLVASGGDSIATENGYPLQSIKIIGASGSIDLQGSQAFQQFKYDDDCAYVIRYK